MAKRAIRICGASGSALDRRHAFVSVANCDDHIDLIIGDWMSEGNMPSSAQRKLLSTPQKATNNTNGTTSLSLVTAPSGEPGYEKSFLTTLQPALQAIARKGIKVAVNAGACDTELLAKEVDKLVAQEGLKLTTAWVSGDEVLQQVLEAMEKKDIKFTNFQTGEELTKWPGNPLFAQAYLGGLGIAKAFEEGADIVLCGRVADASPVIGGAVWWHGWRPENLDELANAFVAGHFLECSTYATGGNFTGFKEVPGREDLGFPIGEISADGGVVMTKQSNTGGMVTVDTLKAQLLYEIQGPWYFNSDVVAHLDGISFEQIGKDRVALHGVKSSPPPPTTKVGISVLGGYQAELHWALVGLDIAEKAQLLEETVRHEIGEEQIKKFSLFECTTYGSVPENPRNQNEATVDWRVFVQAKDQEDISPAKFIQPVMDIIMCTYPGATPHLNVLSGLPRPYYEYYVSLMPQSVLKHATHLDSSTRSISIPSPTKTQLYPAQQPSYDSTSPVALTSFGPTVSGPLGWVVHARSGDKGSNANVGFWVRHEDEWDWLRSLLTLSKIKDLLADEYKDGKKIDRFEIPGMWAVHFLLHDHLDRGVNSTSTYDILGKNVAEFLRCRWVDIPQKFLDRGKI